MLSDHLSFVMQIFDRVKMAFSSKIIQEALANLLESLDFWFRIDRAIIQTEVELAEKEGELRQWANQDSTELSEEISQVRVAVEDGRLKLRELMMQKDKITEDRARLESDIKASEIVEHRRYEVSFETEQTLATVRDECNKLRREVEF